MIPSLTRTLTQPGCLGVSAAPLSLGSMVERQSHIPRRITGRMVAPFGLSPWLVRGGLGHHADVGGGIPTALPSPAPKDARLTMHAAERQSVQAASSSGGSGFTITIAVL